MVLHTCNPSTWGLRKDHPESKAGVGYRETLSQNKQTKQIGNNS